MKGHYVPEKIILLTFKLKTKLDTLKEKVQKYDQIDFTGRLLKCSEKTTSTVKFPSF